MSNRPPPVPPAGRSKKGPAQEQPASRDETTKHGRAPVENTKEQGRQGNIHQNTTNQGYQQDR